MRAGQQSEHGGVGLPFNTSPIDAQPLPRGVRCTRPPVSPSEPSYYLRFRTPPPHGPWAASRHTPSDMRPGSADSHGSANSRKELLSSHDKVPSPPIPAISEAAIKPVPPLNCCCASGYALYFLLLSSDLAIAVFFGSQSTKTFQYLFKMWGRDGLWNDYQNPIKKSMMGLSITFALYNIVSAIDWPTVRAGAAKGKEVAKGLSVSNCSLNFHKGFYLAVWFLASTAAYIGITEEYGDGWLPVSLGVLGTIGQMTMYVGRNWHFIPLLPANISQMMDSPRKWQSLQNFRHRVGNKEFGQFVMRTVAYLWVRATRFRTLALLITTLTGASDLGVGLAGAAAAIAGSYMHFGTVVMKDVQQLQAKYPTVTAVQADPESKSAARGGVSPESRVVDVNGADLEAGGGLAREAPATKPIPVWTRHAQAMIGLSQGAQTVNVTPSPSPENVGLRLSPPTPSPSPRAETASPTPSVAKELPKPPLGKCGMAVRAICVGGMFAVFLASVPALAVGTIEDPAGLSKTHKIITTAIMGVSAILACYAAWGEAQNTDMVDDGCRHSHLLWRSFVAKACGPKNRPSAPVAARPAGLAKVCQSPGFARDDSGSGLSVFEMQSGPSQQRGTPSQPVAAPAVV